jgi:hypothetical protein
VARFVDLPAGMATSTRLSIASSSTLAPAFALGLALAATAAAACSAGPSGAAGEPRVLGTDERVLGAGEIAGVTAIRVASGSGALTVLGDPEATEIRIEAVYYGVAADDEAAAALRARLGVTVTIGGGTLDVATLSVAAGSVDLTLFVPSAVDLDVSDGSEDLDVLFIDGDVRIDDGSGDVRVANIGGSLDLVDGSDEILIKNVTGAVTLVDGSGSVSIEDAGGTVTVEDGSGDIGIDGAGDDVVVIDGSDDIDVANVTGDVTITDGSGNITVQRVGGNLEVSADGSGTVDYSDVAGQVNTF